MGLRIYKEPDLHQPDLIAAWPGIGNIGLIAVDTLRELTQAEMFAEIEPWDFFFPRGITVRDGELKELHFPSCRFYFSKLGSKDLVFFLGEEQPGGGRKGFEMASLVLDLAALLQCQKVYTGAAAVSPVHHSLKPRVWTIPNTPDMLPEMKEIPNTLLMSETENGDSGGNISGLNGLLLGIAKPRGVKGACLLGEMPIYVSQFPTPYPKASKSVLEVFGYIYGVDLDLTGLDQHVADVEKSIDRLYEMIPPEIRENLDNLKRSGYPGEESQKSITENDKKRIMQDIEEFFKKEDKGD